MHICINNDKICKKKEKDHRQIKKDGNCILNFQYYNDSLNYKNSNAFYQKIIMCDW